MYVEMIFYNDNKWLDNDTQNTINELFLSHSEFVGPDMQNTLHFCNTTAQFDLWVVTKKCICPQIMV